MAGKSELGLGSNESGVQVLGLTESPTKSSSSSSSSSLKSASLSSLCGAVLMCRGAASDAPIEGCNQHWPTHVACASTPPRTKDLYHHAPRPHVWTTLPDLIRSLTHRSRDRQVPTVRDVVAQLVVVMVRPARAGRVRRVGRV